MFTSNGPISNESYVIANGTSSNNVFITHYENRDPTTFDYNYPLKKRWINFQNNSGPAREWVLMSYTNVSGQTLANWVLLASGGTSVLSLTVPLGVTEIVPVISTGEITFTSIGGTVAISGSSAAPNNNTVNFDVAGGAVISEITGDDGMPVVPTTGNINFTGVIVPNATNVKPLYFKKNATSTEELDLQLTTATTSGAAVITNAGISSFDSTIFSVAPTTGFVSTLHVPFSRIVVQNFTSSGTYTPTVGMQYCIIEAVGGGGGGGGCASTSSTQQSSGGGGAGAGTIRGTFSAATIGASQAITIGAVGAGGPAGANNGNNGGNTTVGALISATGGGPGLGGAASAVASQGGGGGSPGGGTGGILFVGFVGVFGQNITTATSTGFAIGGAGGASFFGGGGAQSTFGPGNPGIGFGTGGSGAASGFSGSAFAGGNGNSGMVVITEFCWA